MKPDIKCVAILGAGTMGSGIALFFSSQGIRVNLYDPHPEALVHAHKRILQNETIVGRTLSHKNIKYTTSLRECIPDADLIIESAPEDITVKLELYAQIGPLLNDTAIVASNTSTFPLAALSANQIFSDRMIILHFFNPAHLVPLVEIVAAENTLSGLAHTVADFLVSCGKKPVVLKKDIYGFIANRLQAAVLREACFLLEQGMANAGQIDSVMKDGLGIRWVLNGPFEIADLGGLDIWEKVLHNLLPLLSDATKVPQAIQEKIQKNELGLKTGKGFFNYGKNESAGTEISRNKSLLQVQELLERIAMQKPRTQ